MNLELIIVLVLGIPLLLLTLLVIILMVWTQLKRHKYYKAKIIKLRKGVGELKYRGRTIG